MIPFIIFLSFLVRIVNSQEILLEKDFGASSICFNGMLNTWFNSNNQELQTCDSFCTIPDQNYQPVALVSDNRMYNYQISLNTTVTPTQQYSFVEIHIIFYQINTFFIQAYLNNYVETTVLPYLDAQQPSLSYNLDCQGKVQKLSQLTFESQTTLSNNELNVTFSATIDQNSNHYFGLKSIRVSTNCCVNCKICKDSLSCLVCQDGYKLVDFNGTVQKCEILTNCPGGCPSCAYNGGQKKCTSCKAGFTINQSFYCDQNGYNSNCVLNEYTDSQGLCQTKSMMCYYFNVITSSYTTCLPNQILQKFRCSNNKLILVYQKNENLYYKCDCLTKYCKGCSDINTCIECESGYKLDGLGGCQLDCGSNFYDSDSQMCCGLNCEKCNIQQCLICSQANFYKDPNSPSICIQTPITNCQKVDINGICVKCMAGYFLSGNNQNCCSMQNCHSCSTNQNVCDLCTGNYNLEEGVCKCPILNCLNCDDNPRFCQVCKGGYAVNPSTIQCECNINSDTTVCNKCSPGFVFDSVNNVCSCPQNQTLDINSQTCKCSQNFKYDDKLKSCICSVSNCITCTIDKSCSECEKGFILNEQNFSCDFDLSGIDENNFQIKQKLDFNKYDIQVIFDQPIINPTKHDASQIFNVEITKINTSQYKYKIEKIAEKEFKIILEPEISIKSSLITIKIIESSFAQQNNLKNVEVQEQLVPYAKITEDEKQKSEQVADAGKSVSKSVVWMIIPTIFMGNVYIVCNTLDITGFLYYMPFLSIRLPYNVVTFYGLFKDFSFPFIPNMFENIVDPNYTQESPPKFMSLNTDNYFIKNAGQSFTVEFSGFILYLVAKILSYTSIPLISPYFKRAVSETWEFGGLIDVIWSFYIYIIVGVFMQLNTFNFDDEQSSFINYSFHSACSLIYLSIPVFLAALIYKSKNLKDDKFLQLKLSSVLNGLNLYNQNDEIVGKYSKIKRFSKYYFTLLYLRKILFCMIITWCYNYVYLQLALFSIMNIAVIMFIFFSTPFQSKLENFKNFIQELILIIIQICCAFLIEDDESESESSRINIGWIIVSLSGFIICWYTFLTLKDLIISIFSLSKKAVLSIYASFKKLFQKKNNTSSSLVFYDQSNKNMENANKRFSIFSTVRNKESLLSLLKKSFDSSQLIESKKLSQKIQSQNSRNIIEETQMILRQ